MFEQTVSLIPSKWDDWKGMTNAEQTGWERWFQDTSLHHIPPRPTRALVQPLPSLSPVHAELLWLIGFPAWHPRSLFCYKPESECLKWHKKPLCAPKCSGRGCSPVSLLCWEEQHLAQPWEGASCSWQICLFFFAFSALVCGQKIKLNCINHACWNGPFMN